MPDYRYLLLDFDNTLVNFDETERRALLKSCNDVLGLTLNGEELLSYHRINDGYWKALERHEITKPRLKLLRFRDFLIVLEKAHPDLPKVTPENLNASYVKNLASIVVEYPEALPALRKLAEKYRLFVITNGATEVQKGRMAGCSFRNLISEVFISEEYGVSKPDAAFFKPIEEYLGDFDRSHYLVVGDSPTSDMKFAENAGVDACFVTNGQKTKKERRWKYEISDISFLPSLLSENTQ